MSAEPAVETRRSGHLWWTGLELFAAVTAVALDLLIPALARPRWGSTACMPRSVRGCRGAARRWMVDRPGGVMMPMLGRVTGETQDFGVFDDRPTHE